MMVGAMDVLVATACEVEQVPEVAAEVAAEDPTGKADAAD